MTHTRRRQLEIWASSPTAQDVDVCSLPAPKSVLGRRITRTPPESWRFTLGQRKRKYRAGTASAARAHLESGGRVAPPTALDAVIVNNLTLCGASPLATLPIETTGCGPSRSPHVVVAIFTAEASAPL